MEYNRIRKLNGYQKGIFFIAVLFLSWFGQNLAGQQDQLHPAIANEKAISVATTTYYVYKDGEFKEAILTREPEMIGGKALMETLIKLNIRYPEVAKAKKMGGTVLISVVIDTLGQIEDAFVHEGIGGGCNDEALRAVRLMDKVGFEPGEINGKPVIVKFDIPITFLPQNSQ